MMSDYVRLCQQAIPEFSLLEACVEAVGLQIVWSVETQRDRCMPTWDLGFGFQYVEYICIYTFIQEYYTYQVYACSYLDPSSHKKNVLGQASVEQEDQAARCRVCGLSLAEAQSSDTKNGMVGGEKPYGKNNMLYLQ